MSKMYVLCVSFIVFCIVVDVVTIVETIQYILSGVDARVALVMITTVCFMTLIIAMVSPTLLSLASKEYDPPRHIERR